MLAQFLGGQGMEHRPFNTQLRCYSALMFPNANEAKLTEIERGGKILLPASCLDWLTRLHISYPMLFKLTNPKPETQRVTHCGVLEFLAEEGKCYLPHWMMRHLLLEEGQVVQIEYVNLPIATYCKFKPQHPDFLDISNPKIVLEMKLRSFACLTKGDVIAIEYNTKIYEIQVTDVKPGKAVSIVECDMNVDFDAPEGYVEPSKASILPASSDSSLDSGQVASARMTPTGGSSADLVLPQDQGFVPFSGTGNRLDGKGKAPAASSPSPSPSRPLTQIQQPRIVPNLDYKPGTLTFYRDYKRLDLREKEQEESETKTQTKFEAFKGLGKSIRPAPGKASKQ